MRFTFRVEEDTRPDALDILMHLKDDCEPPGMEDPGRYVVPLLLLLDPPLDFFTQDGECH